VRGGYLVAALSLTVAVLGCAGPGGTARTKASDADRASRDAGDLTPRVLDQLTKSYADEYVTLIATACEYVILENPDLEQRRRALRMRSLSATAMYDIVSNTDPFTQLLDLIVAVSLQCRIWIDDGQADDFFGDRGEYLVHGLYEARRSAWRLAARAFTPEQLSTLDSLIWAWRARHPDVRIGCFVRFADFADSRGKSMIENVRTGGGFFKAVSEVQQTADEMRLLAERVFYVSKRAPVVLEWQVEQALTEIMAQPEVRRLTENQDDLVESIRKASDSIEGLPDVVERERKAILDAIDAKAASIGAVVDKGESLAKEVRGAVEDGETLLKQTDETLRVLKATLEVADRLVARVMPVIEAEVPPGEEPFRIKDYTAALRELTTSLVEANKLLAGTDSLLRAEVWRDRIEEVSKATDRLVQSAGNEGVSITNAGFWRAFYLIAAFFGFLAAYRVIVVRFVRPKP